VSIFFRSMAVTSTVSLPADEVGFTELDELGLQKPAIGKRIILEVLERVKFNWSQSKQVRAVDKRGCLRNIFFHFEDPTPHFVFEDIEPGSSMIVKEPKAHMFMDTSQGLRLENPAQISVEKCTVEASRRFYYADLEKADGTKFFGLKRWDLAVDRYAAAIRHLDEASSELLQADQVAQRTTTLALLHLNLAACALQKKKYPEVVVQCQRALSLMPGSAKAYFRMAEAQHVMQELETAEGNYVKALELLPDDAGIRKGLAAVRKDLADRKASEANMYKGMFQKKTPP